jgi:hypothetical protein
MPSGSLMPFQQELFPPRWRCGTSCNARARDAIVEGAERMLSRRVIAVARWTTEAGSGLPRRSARLAIVLRAPPVKKMSNDCKKTVTSPWPHTPPSMIAIP